MEVKPGYKQTDVGVIPEDWGVPRLGDLFEITSSKRVFQSEWKTEGIPFYRAREIAVLGERGWVDNDLFISRQMYDAFRRVYGVPRVGDLLVTGVGTLGKVYVVADEHEFYFKDGNIIWFKIAGALQPEFLRQLYLTPVVVKQIVDSSAGTTVGTYTISGAKKTVIPMPTKAEQEAIAEALSDADGLIESLEQLVAKKRQLKQGAMQELLTGKRRLPGFSGAWEERALLNLAGGKKELFDDGDWIESEHITNEGVRLVQTGNIGVGVFVEKEDKKYIFEASFVSLRCKEIRQGDLLICRLADPAGRSCVLPDIGEERIVTSVDVTIFRPPASVVDRVFLANVFSTDQWFRAVSDLSGGTTHKRISRGALGRLRITVPCVEEQTAIAAILSDMDAEIAVLEAKLAKARQVKQGMMQELLTGRIRLV
jgi:type I restriction enzyme S subunit